MVVGLPSWQALIDHMMDELEIDGTTARTVPGLGHPILAEYYRLRRGSIVPLRSWMDREWKVSEDASAIPHPPARRLARLPADLHDQLRPQPRGRLRGRGRAFHKVANARDLTQADREGTQIVKFHGDFDDDTSLVLTESGLLRPAQLRQPSRRALPADAMSRTLLFIGYSMSDLNIRLLLYRIWETWNRSVYERNRPPSYVFLPRVSPAQAAVLGAWGITVLTSRIPTPRRR
jgi:hypothetical protein